MMNNHYRVWLGGSDLLDKSAVIWAITLRPITDDSFQIIDIQERPMDDVIDIGYYKKLLHDEIGQSDDSIYNLSAKGFYILEYIGDTAPDNRGGQWKKGIRSLGMAFPYIWCGAPWLALDTMDGDTLSLSESHLAQKILPDNMRMNLLAELDYGNWHKHRDLPFLTRDFLGLPEQDPKHLYGSGQEFYIHPAGMAHEDRANVVRYLNVGQPIIFEPEPNNIYDPNAVHIYTDYGSDLAYVPRQIASAMAFHMRRGISYAGVIAAVFPEEQRADDRIAVKITPA